MMDTIANKLLGEKGSIRRRLAEITYGGAQVVGGVVTRSTGLVSEGVSNITGKEDSVIGGSPEERTSPKPMVETPEEKDGNDGFNFIQRMTGFLNSEPIKYDSQSASVINAVQAEEPTVEEKTEQPLVFSRDKLKWQEEKFMPYVETGDGEKFINEFTAKDFPETEPVQPFKIIEAGGSEHIINDQEQLGVANQISRVARAVAPEYENYLLRLANFEGVYNPKQRNYMFNDTFINDEGKEVHYSSRNPEDAEKYGGIWSIDRGIFQINDYFFPGIPDEVADDPIQATLWAISAIETGTQKQKWHANERTIGAKIVPLED